MPDLIHKVRARLRASGAALRRQPLTWVLVLVVAVVGASLVVRAGSGGRASRPLQVQVLNGSGIPELAQRAALALREHRLDVVSIGNADSQGYSTTLVLLRRGRRGVARQVAAALGKGEVLEQRDPTLLVDVTVILGRDYAGDRNVP